MPDMGSGTGTVSRNCQCRDLRFALIRLHPPSPLLIHKHSSALAPLSNYFLPTRLLPLPHHLPLPNRLHKHGLPWLSIPPATARLRQHPSAPSARLQLPSPAPSARLWSAAVRPATIRSTTAAIRSTKLLSANPAAPDRGRSTAATATKRRLMLLGMSFSLLLLLCARRAMLMVTTKKMDSYWKVFVRMVPLSWSMVTIDIILVN